MSTQISDEQLGEALEAFCKRLVEGHPMLPSGENWEDLDLDIQNKVKTPTSGHSTRRRRYWPSRGSSALRLSSMLCRTGASSSTEASCRSTRTTRGAGATATWSSTRL